MGAVAWAELGFNIAATVVVVLILMAFVAGWFLRTGTIAVIDTVWGAGFAAIAVTGLVLSWGVGDNLLRIVVTVLTVVWGVRLAIHIGTRNKGKGEDPRYEQLLARHSGSRFKVALLWVCLPQGVALVVISLPVQFAQYTTDVDAWWLVAVGVAVWLVGFVFEAVGDAQLRAFRADPKNHGRVLDTGLWRYTRHPNYFGDACVWWGLYLCACVSWPGVATIVSPVIMTWLLARGTGKPLTESQLADRPGYREYVERTSGFFPLPPGSRLAR